MRKLILGVLASFLIPLGAVAQEADVPVRVTLLGYNPPRVVHCMYSDLQLEPGIIMIEKLKLIYMGPAAIEPDGKSV